MDIKDLIAQKWCTHNIEVKNVIDYIPGKDIISKSRRIFVKLCLLNEKDPAAKSVFRSASAIAAERDKHIRGHLYMIHPFSKFKRYWDLCVILCILILMLRIPINISFDILNKYNEIIFLEWSFLVVDLWLCADIVVHFMTGYYKKSAGTVSLSFKYVAWKYLRTTFIIDLISGLPFHLVVTIIHYNSQDDRSLVSKISLNILILLVTLRVYQFCQNFTPTIKAIFNLTESTIVLMLWAIIIFISIHWMATFHYTIPYFIQYRVKKKPDPRSWIVRSELSDKSFSSAYFYSFMRTLSFSAAINTNSFFSSTTEDMILTMMSTFTMIFIAGQIWQVILLSAASIKNEEFQLEIQTYIKHNKIKSHIGEQIAEYLDFKYQSHYFSDDENTFKTLSNRLKDEILLHTAKKLLKNMNIFENISDDMKLSIIKNLRKEIYLKNAVITRRGDVSDKMFFISTGTVAVYHPSGKLMSYLENGEHFGEIALLMEEGRGRITVVTVETSEIYSLTSKYVFHIMESSPEITMRFISAARKQAQKIEELTWISKEY